MTMTTHDVMPNEISHYCLIFRGTTAMMTVLSTVSVILRFTSRRLTFSIKWDDWACLGALVFAYGYLASISLDSTVGPAGHHIEEYSMQTNGKIVSGINLHHLMFTQGAISL